MDTSILAQLTPYLWLALYLAGGAVGIVAVFRAIDAIERRHRPKPRGRRA